MTRLRRGLARAATILATIFLWTWVATKIVVTLIGATTVVDDYNQFVARLPAIVNWLFSTPWQVPAGLATILTIFLIWLSWPSGRALSPVGDPVSTSQPPNLVPPVANVDKQPLSKPQADPAGSKRIFVDVTAQYLCNLYKDKTSVQGDALAALYIGKWIRVPGKVRNISTPSSRQIGIQIDEENTTQLVAGYFDSDFKPIIATFTINQRVYFLGRIERINSSYVQLEDCELIT
jgi:hypothetical protein